LYIQIRENVEHLSPEKLSTVELFEFLRKLTKSPDVSERLHVLWIAAEFGERLERCSNAQIGDLLFKVQERMGLLTPEFGVCEQAKRRLQRSSFNISRLFRGQ
jgi:hypothetical protein